MGEPATPANPTDPGNTPDPANPADPGQQPGKGTEPEPKPASSDFDPSTLKDDDFDKIFTDDRVFRHPRFKALNERAKKADQLEKANETAEKKRLEDEGKWKELAEKAQGEAQTANEKVQSLVLKNVIQTEAAKLGIVDIEAAAVLIDKTNVKINDDGTAEGVTEALTALIEAKPYLKGGTPATPVGSPSNPNPNQTEAGTKKFKLSDLQDHAFFKEHEKDIMEAMRKGLVEDDLYGTGGAPQPTPQQT